MLVLVIRWLRYLVHKRKMQTRLADLRRELDGCSEKDRAKLAELQNKFAVHQTSLLLRDAGAFGIEDRDIPSEFWVMGRYSLNSAGRDRVRELIRKARDDRAAKRRESVMFWFPIVSGVLGLVIGMLGTATAFYGPAGTDSQRMTEIENRIKVLEQRLVQQSMPRNEKR